MGRIKGRRQVTLYIDPTFYEEVRCAAYILGEDIYEFAGAAMRVAIDARLTSEQRAGVKQMAELARAATKSSAASGKKGRVPTIRISKSTTLT